MSAQTRCRPAHMSIGARRAKRTFGTVCSKTANRTAAVPQRIYSPKRPIAISTQTGTKGAAQGSFGLRQPGHLLRGAHQHAPGLAPGCRPRIIARHPCRETMSPEPKLVGRRRRRSPGAFHSAGASSYLPGTLVLCPELGHQDSISVRCEPHLAAPTRACPRRRPRSSAPWWRR